MYSRDFADKLVVDLPCELLVYDVCYGSYYCGCENGYWREAYSISKQAKTDLEDSLAEQALKDAEKRSSGGDTLEVSILKGALIAGLIAMFVIAIPCIIIYLFQRQKRMASEVKLVGTRDGQIDKVIWNDKNGI